jgi:3',5'-cyclic AMP phosphodiesterase CpdA
MELTTVADDEAVVHDGFDVRRYDGLEPDHVYEYDGFAFRTLARPAGEHLCTFATVNDVHFGEVECGIIEGLDIGPTFTTKPGEDPYPEVMNRAAVAEIAELDPAALLVKGDLTSRGTHEEYQAFLHAYRGFGERMHHIRGNHESYNHSPFATDPRVVVDLPGVRLVMIDTSLDGLATGGVPADTLTWLDELAASTDRPILLFGHHHVWNPESANRPDSYFGINPDDSERLVELVGDRRTIRGYFAGHTHRNRVRRFGLTREVPWVEVASVKEFPGTWAEYRVYEGGVLQIHRRISSPEALEWTEQTRHLYADTFFGYAFGELADRCFTIDLG